MPYERRFRAHAFHIAREGARSDEWEDACKLSESKRRLAVADGASSSFRAREWAAVLAEQFVDAPPKGPDPEHIETWLADCATRFDAMPVANSESGYVEEAAHRGAFATLLGFALAQSSDAWVAIAVGDTCVFQVRGGTLLGAFPLDDADTFNSTPALLSSELRNDTRGAAAARAKRGTCQPGDVFLIASDAFAQWALRTARTEPRVWALLASIRRETFLALVDEIRGARLIENGDITLVHCVVS